MSGRTRLTGREQPPLSLVQNWLKRLEASPDGIDVNHPVRIRAPSAEARQFLDSFVAFLSASRFFSADSLVLAQALSTAAVPRGSRMRSTATAAHCSSRSATQVRTSTAKCVLAPTCSLSPLSPWTREAAP